MSNATMAAQQQDRPQRPRQGLPALVLSVLAAAFGVQSSRNRERDFSQGNYRHFIVAGVVFTVLFVLAVMIVVRLVLRHAGV